MEISLAVIDRMTDKGWIGKDLEGSTRFLIEVISQNPRDRSEENHKMRCGRIAGVSTEIRTEHLLNMNPEPYGHTNLLSYCRALKRFVARKTRTIA
jgi:hypothetical protein